MIGVIVLHVLPLENHNGRLAGIYVSIVRTRIEEKAATRNVR